MAVDTATKRYSMINYGAGDELFPVPVNGSTAGDRAQGLALYSGINADSPPTITTTGQMMMLGVGT
jgi:hypothetical protein